jgi:hypothetical protein
MTNTLRKFFPVSPELFNAFFTADDNTPLNVINALCRRSFDIAPGVKAHTLEAGESPTKKNEPYITVKSYIEGLPIPATFVMFPISESNYEKSEEIISTLAEKLHKEDAPFAFIAFDSSDRIKYQDPECPVDTYRGEIDGQTYSIMLFDLCSEFWPDNVSEVVKDLLKTNENEMSTGVIRNAYIHARKTVGIENLEKAEYTGWLNNLEKDIQALGINPADVFSR